MRYIEFYFIFRKVIYSVKRFIAGKRAIHREIYRYGTDQIPKHIPKKIWIYWDKGWDKAPALAQICSESWKIKNPDWNIALIDDKMTKVLLDIDWIEKKNLSPQSKSDIIRINLLYKHGGVWVDSTTLCITPLTEWLPPLMQSGFFAFPDTNRDRSIQSWFIASTKNHIILEKWREIINIYWKKNPIIKHYFWLHYLFDLIIIRNETCRHAWAITPKLSPRGPHIIKRILTNNNFPEPIEDDLNLDAIPLLKFSSHNLINESSFLEMLKNKKGIAEYLCRTYRNPDSENKLQ